MDLKQETYGTRTLARFLIKKIRVCNLQIFLNLKENHQTNWIRSSYRISISRSNIRSADQISIPRSYIRSTGRISFSRLNIWSADRIFDFEIEFSFLRLLVKDNALELLVSFFCRTFPEWSKKYFTDHQTANTTQLYVAIKGNISGLFFFCHS